MGDLPDYLMLVPQGEALPPQPGFPHLLALLPSGITLTNLSSQAPTTGIFLIDPDCAFDTMNGAAFVGYLEAGVPVLLYAQRRRELKPFRKRAAAFAQRGYRLVDGI